MTTSTKRTRKPAAAVKVEEPLSSAADLKPAVDPAGADLSAPAGSVADRDARIAAAVKTHLKPIGTAVKQLRDVTATVVQSTTALGFARVQLGAALLPVLNVLTDESGSFKWKESSAVDHIVQTYLKGETGPDGKPYAASTVRAWITAAEQESLLPEEHRNRFGSDAHRTLARVRKAKGDKTFATFASGLAKRGDVSVGKVRAAYDKKYPAAPKPEESAASVAASIQADEIESATMLRSFIAKLGMESTVLVPLLNVAAGIGQRHPDADPEAMLIAIRFLAKQPKEKK